MKKIISIIFIFVAFLSVSPTLTFAAPPATPTVTSISPALSISGIPYSISFTTTDPDFGDQVYYQFDWDRNGIFEERYPLSGTVPTGGAPRGITHTWATPGDNSFHMRATDSNGNSSPYLTTSITLAAPNGAPTNPVINTNPTDFVNVIHNISVVSTDLENDNIKYEVDWGNDGIGDAFIPSSGYYSSGTTGATSISWGSPGSYVINFRTYDDKGNRSSWTSKTITITTVQVPANPVVTTPSSTMYTGVSYPVAFSSTDPNGDQVYYEFDWNLDGVYEERHPTSGTVPSGGAPRSINHTWTNTGINGFYVRTTDTGGNSSGVVREEVTLLSSLPPTVTITADPATLDLLQSSPITLTWSSTNTSSCVASGSWIGIKAVSGTLTTTAVNSSKTYTLTCTGTNGQTVAVSATVNVAVKLIGWAWSSNIGWISFNSANSGAGFGATYAVTVATSSGQGTFGGYAWSSNIGWISFGSGDASHPNATVDLTTGAVSGWARACSATVNGDCTGGDKTGGWDGWISLSGTNHESPTPDGTRGVTLNSLTGKFNGFSWGSDVVGWLTFDTALSTAPPVTCLPCITGNTPAPRCDITVNNVIGNQATLSWTKTGMDAATSCTLGGASTNPVTKTLISGPNTFIVSCSTAPVTTCKTIINYDGAPPPVTINGQMWVEDDTTRIKTTTVIRTGKDAIVNWEIDGDANRCEGVVRSVVPSNLVTPSWFNPGNERAAIPGLAKGVYNLGIDCDGGAVKTNDVRIIVKDSTIEEI